MPQISLEGSPGAPRNLITAQDVLANARRVERLRRRMSSPTSVAPPVILAAKSEGFHRVKLEYFCWSFAWKNKPSPIEKIIQIVCEKEDISRYEIISHSRIRRLVNPRHIAMYLAAKLSGKYLTVIGRYFDGRDHTTIMYARDKIAWQRLNDADLNARLVGYEAELGN